MSQYRHGTIMKQITASSLVGGNTKNTEEVVGNLNNPYDQISDSMR